MAWLKGLAVMIITSAASAGAGILAGGGAINWRGLATACGMAGLLGALLYLTKSPFPTNETTEAATDKIDTLAGVSKPEAPKTLD